jgi:gliding motility-associated-like protein
LLAVAFRLNIFCRNIVFQGISFIFPIENLIRLKQRCHLPEACFKLFIVVCLVLLSLFAFSAKAQLQANFTMDKNRGCSPLAVAFTNTTTGASANATYQWNFGNGNTSALPNAAATYITEQSYIVTLTVTDGNKISSSTKQVIVYKRPTADFSFDVKKGCLPVSVNFTAAATPGDGSIANYFWDFGDGNTQQASSPQIQHLYNLAQQTSVGLTVMNSYGCYTSVEKKAVQVLPAIQAAFSVNDTVLCNITDPVLFTNLCTGPGTLSYQWDFGDGTNSSSVNPKHVYNKKGTYTIKLTATSTEGCSVTGSQVNYINVANFKPGFTVPVPLCLNSFLGFKDTSTNGGANQQWFVDGTNQTTNYYDSAFNYAFLTTGQHLIQLTATYGKCTVSDTQKVFVNGLPDMKPFITDIPKYCQIPVTISFKDTTKDAVSWEWTVNGIGPNYIYSTSQSTSYNVVYPLQSYVFLKVKNAAGCSAMENQNVNIDYIYGGIQIISRSGCDSISIVFGASRSRDSIITYLWKFSDGGTSSLATPAHVYATPGNYTVTLLYVTANGCTGNYSFTDVNITRKPHADFTVPSTTICGNTFTPFLSTSTGDFWTPMWRIARAGSTSWEITGFNTEQRIQFNDTGYYSVQLILFSNEGWACNDTMTKINFVKVLPPVPKISGYLNTCDNTRGLVRFTENSINPTTWIWDFGDSTTLTYSSKRDTILHTYTKTGDYKVLLKAVNGACSVSDSIYTAVLLKQNPMLSVQSNQVCTNGSVKIWIGNYELNPDPHFYDAFGWDGFSVFKFEYGDGITFTGEYNRVDTMGYSNPWYTQLTASLTNLKPFETSFRAISTSAYFGCNDTSNYVPLKINGPKADFKISGGPCFEYPAILQDISVAGTDFPIKKWEWNFGDGYSDIKTQSGTELHGYQAPGQYPVHLNVTDGNGCYDSITHYINLSGPKASFNYLPANVTPNSLVTFSNTTNTFNTFNTRYQWIFGDGTTSTDYSPLHTYATTGAYTVKLISINPDTQCRDTSIQIINVKLINTAFSFIKSYVSASTCPPVIVRFTNTAINAQSISWDFGDGSIADNQNNPSHTYYAPGTFKITLYGFGYNGTKDTTVDSITVRAPFAQLKADKLSGCLSQTVTLTAAVANASYITWDFADGTIQQTQDTFAVHQYATPGLYNPSLILLDSGGCYLTAKLTDTIIIDDLTVALPKNKKYCDAASVFFDPAITSVAATAFNQPLTYHWNFGTGKSADTANIVRPTFNYTNPGKYLVSLLVQSPYGCIKEATDSIVVAAGSVASITGPADICKGQSTLFKGQATNNVPGISWQWNFGNGNTANQENPAATVYADTGNIRIYLIVINAGCADTAFSQLTVHNNPVINAIPKQSSVCLGKSVTLSAGGGNVYVWSPAFSLDNSSSAMPVASPPVSTIYIVKITNSFGCSNIDSVDVTVVQPFTVKLPPGIMVCTGNSVQLNATGAATYNWINNTAGLSNIKVSNPVATPGNNILYTVVGYDAGRCFTDTAIIRIKVNPLPVLDHEPNVETLAGTPVQLQATGSADVLSWSWLPADYLTCSNCAAPVSTPLNPVTYVVSGKTVFGCVATDTISIKLTCAISKVFVPAVFSPNNDGKNDMFTIQGTGVNNIRWIRIFNRYGEMVFEKRNSQVGDRSAGWDGTVKNSPASAGTYVYMAELTCASGEVFPLKGTVILAR